MTNEATGDKANADVAGQVDPLVMRGVELTGDYFADCNLLVSIIDADNRAMAEAVKIITEMCQCFGIPLPEDTIKRLGA